MFREKFLRQRINELEDRYNALVRLITEYFHESGGVYPLDSVLFLQQEIARLRNARERAAASAHIRGIVKEVIIEAAKDSPHGG